MPIGRPFTLAGSVNAERISQAISVRSIRLRAKAGTKIISIDEIRKMRETLRWSFRRYQIDRGRKTHTSTELKKIVGKAKTAARHLVKKQNWTWADKLLNHLETDPTTAAMIRRHLKITGYEWIEFKKALRSVVISRKRVALPDKAILITKRLAEINAQKIVSVSRWSDPALTVLVKTLVPLWKRVTGRTAGFVSIDREAEAKACPFADWLSEMLDLMRFPRPPVGRVVDIVRTKK